MTLQRVVSAHAAAAAAASGLVIRRLESMQGHANRQVVHALCASAQPSPSPSPARPGGQCRPQKVPGPGATQGLGRSLVCQSCSDIAVEGREEREAMVRRQGGPLIVTDTQKIQFEVNQRSVMMCPEQ